MKTEELYRNSYSAAQIHVSLNQDTLCNLHQPKPFSTMLHIKKLTCMGMHHKETYMQVCARIDICLFTKNVRIIHICKHVVQRYLSCTVIN